MKEFRLFIASGFFFGAIGAGVTYSIMDMTVAKLRFDKETSDRALIDEMTRKPRKCVPTRDDFIWVTNSR